VSYEGQHLKPARHRILKFGLETLRLLTNADIDGKDYESSCGYSNDKRGACKEVRFFGGWSLT